MIGRGTALDSSLHGYIQRAIRYIERKKNFTFMYHLNRVTNDLQVDHPRTLRVPNRRIRDIDFMRITQEDGEELEQYKVLNKSLDMSVWNPPESDYPSEYFLVQEDLIIFDNTPAAVYTFDVGWWEYTVLPTGDTTQHWLFDNVQDLVEDLALIYACRAVRDFDRAMKIWFDPVSGTGVKSVLDDFFSAEEDKELGDAEVVMRRDFYSELGG